MKRDPARLESTKYDVVIVGGGIYGACIARDAALRGLRVALVERGDFGGGTSHNSLKLIHGGFRYLQHLNLRRTRESVRERRYWLWAAPHLVRPLKFVIPAYGYGTRGPEAMWAAFKAYGLLAADRNRGLPEWQQVPAGETVSAADCAQLIPEMPMSRLRGGAIWYDGQMRDSDRVLLECLTDASEAGAVVCNYVAAEGFIHEKRCIAGVHAKDMLSGNRFAVCARMTVNACGPWAYELGCNERVADGNRSGRPALSKCMNLVTRRIGSDHAFGLASDRVSDARVGKARRLFFFAPWRGRTIIGTSHFPYHEDPDACRFSWQDKAEFLEEVNAAYPAAALTMSDVYYCYGGLTPSEDGAQRGEVKRSHRGLLIDHAVSEAREGLITVVGEKYTTARRMAERVVELVFRKQDRSPPPCLVRATPLPGARGLDTMDHLRRTAAEELGVLPGEAIVELLESYGSRFQRVLAAGEWQKLRGDASDREELFRRRCFYSIDSEMAQRLADVVLRRSDLAARGLLSPTLLHWAADLMAARLGWTAGRKRAELEDVQSSIRLFVDRGRSAPVAAAQTP